MKWLSAICVFGLLVIVVSGNTIVNRVRIARQFPQNNFQFPSSDQFGNQFFTGPRYPNFGNQNQNGMNFPQFNQGSQQNNNNNDNNQGQNNNQGQQQQQQQQQQAAATTTTPLPPSVLNCVQQCPSKTTSEYNPVCGSDGQNYPNPARLTCAQQCGANVQSTRQGVCQPLITSIVPGGQDSVRIEFEDYE